MLKKLALKFKNQSLNEVRPYEPQVLLSHQSDLEDGGGKSDQEDEEITNICNDTTASPTLDNNNVNASNSKGEHFQPIDAEGRERVAAEENRKTEVVAGSRFTPMEVPVVRDFGNSAEKRKWSQMNAHKLLNQLASSGDSSSSDDEVKEFCGTKTPVSLATCSSPPGKVTILSKHSSAFTSRNAGPMEGHARKKHRVIFADCDPDRPSLDFEKMQKVTLKKSHSLARPRVKIRAISHSGQRTGLCNPEVLCFRPIQLSAHRSLAPVEEPGFVF